MDKRKRDKNYPVKVTNEDFARMGRAELGLSPEAAEKAAVAFAAIRNLHMSLGAGCGQRAFDVIANSLPKQYANNWIKGQMPLTH